MDESRKISVLIPVYGVEPYLRRCLDSVINNTYKNLEIICVNDGSKDNCLSILREYEAKDPRIVVIDKPNGGLPSARNAAIEVATGEYIAHVDSDDWVHHQYFELLMKAVADDDGKTDIVMCGYRSVENQDTVKEQAYEPDYLNAEYGGLDLIKSRSSFRIQVWGKIYRRAVIGSFRQPGEIVKGEDECYNAAIISRNKSLRVALISQPLYYYRRRSGSIIREVRVSGPVARTRIDWMVNCAETAISPEVGAFLGMNAFKSVLSCRYSIMFRVRRYPEEKLDYTDTVRSLRTLMKASPYTNRRELLVCMVMYYCPFLYRLSRIVTDRSLLIWEKYEKERYARH